MKKRRVKLYVGTVEACEHCPNYSGDGSCCREDVKEIKDENTIPEWCPLEDV